MTFAELPTYDYFYAFAAFFAAFSTAFFAASSFFLSFFSFGGGALV